ncbi:MotA/TolQ/ExbB proton channel family protein [Albidovulum sp.]|uniref:MotA/TolQ/ExbB proton channel family protein n=1 Tax=Albidovulum sp. TaxID=1872424 RepID=UPI001DA16312|nr:MotA/TolQ/ExbB proton channel family protein [Paracoccaceae bacterium]MCC0046477.1 MotA/TolQ/ExbB proton channel family protein [Defluviimonas sp.]HPE26176.1 MotA/TolQ/ExbB proton channel family protein [Albidovulum sp.]MCB2119467.1 MotA/TolQ/ExbB proton channel family protein [Paracoccaceae bacterium]MCB2121996.1 MotA/TolQ/ExbB proton channel family protein [Paracoccaceae bacterium]
MGGLSFGILKSGGPIMVVLAALSLASLALIAVKVIELWSCRSGEGARRTAIAKWAAGDTSGARAAVAGGKAPADRVTAAAMAGLQAGMPRDRLLAEVTRRGNAELDRMNRHIRLLELIAMVSPLLGLLGTVTGMIQSFQELAAAEGAANASVLAGGIWQALLTTAAGLLVAIPAAIAAALLAGRAEGAAAMMEQSVGALMTAADGHHLDG